jgi:hypothetical protein
VPVWHLRLIAVVNLMSAVSLTARQEVHTHSTGELFTPFMLFAGYGSAAAALFMAMMPARHKRMGWPRRRPRPRERLVEFMVLDLIERSREVGVERVSLNFAMFRSVVEAGARLGAGPVLRLWRSALVFCSRWWQLESLYRANAKYRPIWEPRFLLFAKSAHLPRSGLAGARAEGFIVAPRPLARLRQSK